MSLHNSTWIQLCSCAASVPRLGPGSTSNGTERCQFEWLLPSQNMALKTWTSWHAVVDKHAAECACLWIQTSLSQAYRSQISGPE